MVPQELLLSFPESDRLLIVEEAMADPAFGEQLSQVLSQPEGVKAVALCLRRAIANEMDPKLYPESRGMWPKARKTISRLAVEMPDIIEKELARLPLETLTEMLNMVAEGRSPFAVAVSGMGAGEFGWGSLFGSLIEAGAGIFEKKLDNAAQIKMVNLQSSAAAATLDAQTKIANAQLAIANAQATQATESSVLTKDIGGVPFWVIPTVVVAAGMGIIIYFKTRNR